MWLSQETPAFVSMAEPFRFPEPKGRLDNGPGLEEWLDVDMGWVAGLEKSARVKLEIL